MRMLRTALWFGLAVQPTAVSADLVVNEVLANEPASDRSLEWVELYNDSPSQVSLSFFDLRVYSATDSASFVLDGILPAQAFMVLCRNVARFEQHWGDSSGVWGDGAEENFTVDEFAFDLINTDGRVALFRLLTPYSELAWTDGGADGVSWERLYPTSLEIAQSLDPSGSTPGRVNSHTPVAIDLALDDASALAVDGVTHIAFAIVNRGRSTVIDGMLNLHYFDAGAPDSLGAAITSEPIGQIDSAMTVILVKQYVLAGVYQQLAALAVAAGDSRPYNDRFDFVAPGSSFPPVVLNEFLANPVSGGSEWVELKNVSDETIDLYGWSLGDSLGAISIASTALPLEPSSYLVLAKDSTAFLATYPSFDGRCHQPLGWRDFNDAGDSVRLVDRFGLAVDAFYYSSVYAENYTWSRDETDTSGARWGRSQVAGGTPGKTNTVEFPGQIGRSLKMAAEPRIFSPDGDGRDDSTVIFVSAPEADAFTLEIYDSDGRLVRTMVDGAEYLAESYVWNGRGDGGERLPIGIYILYFEAEGVESTKTTVVVAR